MKQQTNSVSAGVNTWVRRVLWAMGGVLALWGLAWLLVPAILKSQIEKHASEALGRQVSIGQIDFKPWTLELDVGDLAIAGAKGAGAAPQLHIKRIYIDAELQSLLRLAPVIDALTVESPTVRLKHLGSGRYDIDDVLERLAKRSADSAGDSSAPMPHFALFNLALTGGSIDFEDGDAASVQTGSHKIHALRELTMTVPFLSNLESRRSINTEPRLAFKLNGSTFDSAALATPFAQTRKADAVIKLSGFDLKPYLGYVPPSVPVRLKSAVLNADLRLAFEQATRPVVKLSGSVELQDAWITDARDQDLLTFDGLKLGLSELRPLEQLVAISALELVGPRFRVSRESSGMFNWMLSTDARNAAKNVANNDQDTGAFGKNHQKSMVTAIVSAQAASAAASKSTFPAPPHWQLAVAKLNVRNGSAQWVDATLQPAARLELSQASLEASSLSWPWTQPVPFEGAATVGDAASLRFSGSASLDAASVQASLGNWPLALASPYLAPVLVPALQGSLSAELGARWKSPDDVQLSAKKLSLSNLALMPGQSTKTGNTEGPKSAQAPGQAALASIRQLDVSDVLVDLPRQTVSVGRLVVANPKATLLRQHDGRWMVEQWLKHKAPEQLPNANQGKDPKPVPGPVAGSSSPTHAAPTAWRVLLSDFALDGGMLGLEDRAPARPVVFEVSALKLGMKNFTTEGTKPAMLNVSGRIRSAADDSGQFDYKGNLSLNPLQVQGRVAVSQIPVHAFEPYFGSALNVNVLRADAGFKGDVRYAQLPGGAQIKVNGDVLVEDFRANTGSGQAGAADAPAGPLLPEDLLAWNALSLQGLDVEVAPDKPTRIGIKETALSDYFARIIIFENGHINLQDLVKSTTLPEAAVADAAGGMQGAPDAAKNIANSDHVTGAIGQKDQKSSEKPVISIGPVSLINGRVLFSDRFIKPNYSANLSELSGRLSAFSSATVPGEVSLADLALRGRAEGTASLEILGKLNPLAQPLALDITGRVRDLELPPLSPYAVKYAGHGIERGKLSVDVAYVVKPDGQLSASNNIVLNQLVFGDKVEGAPNSLPVRLAVALLADRQGVIDINLPISGSLNDPQFRLGPIIFKVIVNLVVKAITSPFSLLASAFGGGGDELGVVTFAPGQAVLADAARAQLDKVAKALADRPALKMTVSGSASLEAEREAWRRERLRSLMLAEKRRAAVAGGAGAGASDGSGILDAEVPALLKEVYKRADIAKPRNLLGMAKELPHAEMEALLLANVVVTEDVMRELALQRAVAVKDYLASKQLPVERLYLGAAKSANADAGWTPRAELNLASN